MVVEFYNTDKFKCWLSDAKNLYITKYRDYCWS